MLNLFVSITLNKDRQPLLLSSQFDAAENGSAKPFVKWVGGKRSLIKQLMMRLPDRFDAYYEPFLGGGALFFALRSITGGGRIVSV